MLAFGPTLYGCQPPQTTIPKVKNRVVFANQPIANPSDRLSPAKKKALIEAKLTEIAIHRNLPPNTRIVRINIFIPTNDRLYEQASTGGFQTRPSSAGDPPLRNTFSTQALPLPEITQIRAEISGINIDTPIVPSGANANGFVSVPAEGVVTLDFIVPVGNNRIVTVVGYTTEGSPVPGSTLKSAIDVRKDSTEPSAIDFETTMAADAIEAVMVQDKLFASLLPASEVQRYNSQLQQLLNLPSPLFLNTDSIAQTLFDANTDTRPGYPPIVPDLTTVPIGYDQQLIPGRVTVYVKTTQGNKFPEPVTVQIHDPTSEIATIAKGSSTPASATIDRVLPGIWSVAVRKADGTLIGANNFLFVAPDGTVTGLQQGTESNPFIFDFQPPPPQLTDLQLEFKQFLESFNNNTHGFQLVPPDPTLRKIVIDLFKQPGVRSDRTHEEVMNTVSQFLRNQGIVDGIANLSGAFLALKFINGDIPVIAEDNSIMSSSHIQSVANIYRELFEQTGQFIITSFTTKIVLNNNEALAKITSRPAFTTSSSIFSGRKSIKESNKNHVSISPELSSFHTLQATSQLITEAGAALWRNKNNPGLSFFSESPSQPPQGVNVSEPSKIVSDSGLILTIGGPLFITTDNPTSGSVSNVFDYACTGALLTPIIQCLYNIDELPVPENLTGTLYFGIREINPGLTRSATALFLQGADEGQHFCVASHKCNECGLLAQKIGVITGLIGFIGSLGTVLYAVEKGVISASTFGGGIAISIVAVAGIGYATWGAYNGPVMFSQKICSFIGHSLNSVTPTQFLIKHDDIKDGNTWFPLNFVYFNTDLGSENVIFKIVDKFDHEIFTLKRNTVPADTIHFQSMLWNFKDNSGNLIQKGKYQALILDEGNSKKLSTIEIEVQ